MPLAPNFAEPLAVWLLWVALPMENVVVFSAGSLYLNNYLLDGRIELSNNRAERSIKPFVISQKNFLFANTARGAKSSAVIFSLIETAKENGLDPYRYLTWLFTEAPRLSQADPDWASKLLPWNAPENCRPAK